MRARLARWALAAALLAPIPALAAGHHGSLYEGRGFRAGRCYTHPAVRRCRLKPEPVCDLELFPERTGALHFALDPARDALLKGEDTTDYGVFEFRVDSIGPTGRPKAHVIGVRDVPLRKWESVQDPEPVAHDTPCSRP